jgi:hypothetical protein
VGKGKAQAIGTLLLGSTFLLLAGAGPWALDARLAEKERGSPRPLSRNEPHNVRPDGTGSLAYQIDAASAAAATRAGTLVSRQWITSSSAGGTAGLEDATYTQRRPVFHYGD